MFEEYKIKDVTKDSILEGIEDVNQYFESIDIADREEVLTVIGKALGLLHFIKSELERAERV